MVFFGSIKIFLAAAFSGAVIGLVIGIIYAVAVTINLETRDQISTIYYIENLQDNSTSSGEFFLGTGNIEGGMKYAFYYKLSDSLSQKVSYKLVLLDYKQTSISYTKDRPRVDILEKVYVDVEKAKYAFSPMSSSQYIIYVPEGTIKNNFSLDAQ